MRRLEVRTLAGKDGREVLDLVADLDEHRHMVQGFELQRGAATVEKAIKLALRLELGIPLGEKMEGPLGAHMA